MRQDEHIFLINLIQTPRLVRKQYGVNTGNNDYCHYYSITTITITKSQTFFSHKLISDKKCHSKIVSKKISLEKFHSKNFTQKMSLEKFHSKNFTQKISLEKFH